MVSNMSTATLRQNHSHGLGFFAAPVVVPGIAGVLSLIWILSFHLGAAICHESASTCAARGNPALRPASGSQRTLRSIHRPSCQADVFPEPAVADTSVPSFALE